MTFEQDTNPEVYTTNVHIETLKQPQTQQDRFQKYPDVERLGPIHGNLEKRATEALKYLTEVRIFQSFFFRTYNCILLIACLSIFFY